jgi:hypothetical protein
MALLAQLMQISDASLGNPGAMAALLPLVMSHSFEKVRRVIEAVHEDRLRN